MSHLIAIPSVGRVKITPTRQGIAITIPTSIAEVLNDLRKITATNKSPSGDAMGYSMMCIIWSAAGVFFITFRLIEAFYGTFTIDWWWLYSTKYLLVGVFYVFIECLLVGIPLAKVLSGKEQIVITETGITIGNYILGLGRSSHYQFAGLSRFDLSSGKIPPHVGTIRFKYNSFSRECGKNLTAAEAEQLAAYLNDLCAFRCATTERIIFGTLPELPSAPRSLPNPDVTNLTFPFIRLKEVIIDAATHDFYLVERFLTYAINSIGQAYLKEHVEAHIYGDPEQLHPNLRNSLTNLCKDVVTSSKELI